MALREDLLPDVQVIRDIAVEFGIRRFQVWTRVISWSGSRPGVGTETVTDTYLGRVKVRDVKSKDVVAGMSELTDSVFELGPFTPEHFAATSTPDTIAPTTDMLAPPQTGATAETYYLLKGPGLSTDGVLCQRVGDTTTKPFRYTVTVKAIGRKAGT